MDGEGGVNNEIMQQLLRREEGGVPSPIFRGFGLSDHLPSQAGLHPKTGEGGHKLDKLCEQAQ